MPLQINTFHLKTLLQAHDRDTAILKKHYQEELRLAAISETEVLLIFAKRKAIRKVLVEVGKKQTTAIAVSQIELFK